MNVPLYLMLNNSLNAINNTIEKENSEVNKEMTTYKDNLDDMLMAFDRYKKNVKENNNE